MQKVYKPYNTKLENQMELSSLYVIFVSFFLALLSTLLGSQAWITVLIITMNSIWLLYFASKAFVFPLFQNGNVKKKLVKMKSLHKKSASFDPMSQ